MVSFPANQSSGKQPGKPPARPNEWQDDASSAWGQEAATKQPSHSNMNDDIPSSLRPGFGAVPKPVQPPPERNVWAEQSSTTPEPADGIPSMLRPGGTGNSNNLNPFRQGTTPPPSESMANMSLNQPPASNNPWGASLLAQTTGPQRATPPQLLPEQDPWAAQGPIEMDATPISKPVNVPTNLEEAPAWGEKEEPKQKPAKTNEPMSPEAKNMLLQEHRVWGDAVAQGKPVVKEDKDGELSDGDDWNIIDSETSSVAPDDEFQDLGKRTDNAGKKAAVSAPAAVTPVMPFTHTASPAIPLAAAAIPSIPSARPVTPPLPPISPPSAPASAPPIPPAPVSPPSQVPSELAPPARAYSYEPPPGPPPSHLAAAAAASSSNDLLIEGLEETLPSPEQTGIHGKPTLPPRSQNQAKWSPTRAPVDGKRETYQVKNIRWHDVNARKNPRTSPILIQNENGPCPLVALVNALSLTTPADIGDTPLVHALQSREQISLSLVLEVVFDELMSPRRTSSEDDLPDVSELYGFLQSLHTGMNVNPRFVPAPEVVEAYKRSSLTHLDTSDREELMPGTFENSLEMALYATFSIPLIHGWLPRKTDPVYAALERQSTSYEDAQNLMFREEELDEKLSSHGLSSSEQQLYQDILVIKMFLNESATQLTRWGIEVISRAIRPGTFAILFRNDHFSTLYCHPQTMQLMTLVTDAGYSSHDEVVWETLVDVNGDRNDLLSGDFRPIGSGAGSSAAGPSSGSHAGDDMGGAWTTVQSKRGKGPEQPLDLAASQKEQEDRDLALALQLQEEEEQREREESERRRRETQLSEQFIEQQGQRPDPVRRDDHRRTSSSTYSSAPRLSSTSINIPVTTSAPAQPPQQPPRPQTQEVRPLVPPRRPGVHRPQDASEEAPPSYEQSANDRTYVPQQGQPQGQAQGQGPTQQQQNPGMGPSRPSRYSNGAQPVSQGQGPYSYSGSGYSGRRRDWERDRDCVVM